MKKSTILFLFLILILNIFIISIKAQVPSISNTNLGDINPETGLPNEIEKIKGIGENLTDPEIRSQYLKKEWGKILEKNRFFGPIIKGYGKISPYTDPIFNLVLGIPPSLTWLFVLTLIIWVSLTIYILRFLELFSIVSKFTQYLIFIAMIITISFSRISLKLAEWIISTISLFTTWWMQLIGIFIIIIILILASIFSKQVKEFFEKAKKRRVKIKEEANRMELEKNVKVSGILARTAAK